MILKKKSTKNKNKIFTYKQFLEMGLDDTEEHRHIYKTDPKSDLILLTKLPEDEKWKKQ